MFCSNCGNEAPEGSAFCQHCGTKLAAGPGLEQVGGRVKTPWEDREQNGFVSGLFSTIREVLFTPSAFFKKMQVKGGLTDPLLFGLIVGMVGLMFLYFWDIVLHDSVRNMLTPELRAIARDSLAQSMGVAVTAAITPLMLVIWLFTVSGLLNLFLMFVRGARAGYEATFRVVSYSLSPFFFLAIPFCGSLLTAIWFITLAVIGLREAHETSGGKAAFAVFFPVLCCCGFMILAAVLFMGAVAASFGTLMHMSN